MVQNLILSKLYIVSAYIMKAQYLCQKYPGHASVCDTFKSILFLNYAATLR